MGCGGSKFDPEGKMIQSASIHPLLKRRILDQLRRRRREALKEDPTVNHSTKKLLRYKNNDANDHKDSNSSASNISFKLDHDNDAIATDEETPRTSSFVPSDYDSSDDDGNNNSKKNQQELLKPIYKEHHDVNNNDIKIDDDRTTTTAAAAPTTTTIRIAVATTTTTTPALEGKFDHKHDDKNTIANNDDNHDDTFNLPVPLITENHAVIIYHQKAVDVAENKDKSAAPVAAAAAAAAEKDKDRDDEFLTAEEEAEEVVLVVVNEEEEDDPSYIYPGSPSFRVYCINSSIISDDEEEDSQDDNNQCKEDDATKKKTESDESGGTFESVNSNEGQESIAQTKNANWKRIRRLKKKIGRKGTGPVKVKQLLNVKACYNPATACSGGHDRARLLAAHKQAAVSS